MSFFDIMPLSDEINHPDIREKFMISFKIKFKKIELKSIEAATNHRLKLKEAQNDLNYQIKLLDEKLAEYQD